MLEPAVAPAVARVPGAPGAKPAPSSQGAAVYTFDEAAHCPYCRHAIRTVRVVRLSRTQVAFTSTLPANERFFSSTSALQVGREIWIGTITGDRIARYPIP